MVMKLARNLESNWMVTPTRKLSDFHLPLSLEDKMSIFCERIDGWYLGIAEKVLNGEKDAKGKLVIEAIPHSAYAVLNIVLSYFEMIAKYQDGYIKERKSKHYFKKGILLVFPELNKEPQKIVDDLLDIFYEKVRCGLFHSYHTGDKVFITNKIQGAIGLTTDYKLYINPHLLIPSLRQHFKNYVTELEDVTNNILRYNFEIRFNFDNAITR